MKHTRERSRIHVMHAINHLQKTKIWLYIGSYTRVRNRVRVTYVVDRLLIGVIWLYTGGYTLGRSHTSVMCVKNGFLKTATWKLIRRHTRDRNRICVTNNRLLMPMIWLYIGGSIREKNQTRVSYEINRLHTTIILQTHEIKLYE